MKSELNLLYDQIYGDEKNNEPRKFIELIAPKLSLLEDIELKDNDDYNFATAIVSDYGIMLYRAGYYQKSIKYINVAIKQFENFTNLKYENLLEEPKYESLLFHRAMVLYDLKQYSQSALDFKRLAQKYPDNDRYLSWLKLIKSRRYSLFEWMFALITIISLIFIFFWHNNDSIEFMSRLTFIIGLIGGISMSYLRNRT
jgi:tetratricopeptide (TPR) repeat protein